MKTLSSLVSALGLLGLLALGCKNPIEPVVPKSPADCRIIATVYKTTIEGRESGPKYELETITLSDGSTATISLISKTTYKYDEKDRIVEIDSKLPSGSYFLNRYTYVSDRVLTYEEVKSTVSNTLHVTRDSLPLYPNGLWSGALRFGAPDLRYNQDGQLTGGGLSINRPAGDSCRYEQGNCVEKIQGPLWQNLNGKWIPTDYLLITYQYDLSRPNLRPFLQFEGNPSRNLPVTEQWAMRASSEFPNTTVYQKTYRYVYDQYGRVIRRIAHGQPRYRGWLIEDDYNGVGVTDYEYECP